MIPNLQHQQNPHTYQFNQLVDCLTAFIADFEINLHFVKNSIPVLMQNTGDETYWYDKKWRKSGDDKYKEIYHKVPRVIIDFPDDFGIQIEQNTSKFTQFNVKQKNNIYAIKGRRQAILLPINIDFICSNSILALGYFEMLLSILHVDNVFTYETSGNTYQTSYNINQIQMIKPILGGSDTRNFVIKIGLEVSVQLMLANLKTIRPINETGFDKVGFIIDSYESDNSDFHRTQLDIQLDIDEKNGIDENE